MHLTIGYVSREARANDTILVDCVNQPVCSTEVGGLFIELTVVGGPGKES